MTNREERIAELTEEERYILEREHSIPEHLCPVCGGSGEIPEETEDGEFGDMLRCQKCDGYGVEAFWDTLKEYREKRGKTAQ